MASFLGFIGHSILFFIVIGVIVGVVLAVTLGKFGD